MIRDQRQDFIRWRFRIKYMDLKRKSSKMFKNQILRKSFHICSGVSVETNILLFIFCVNIAKFSHWFCERSFLPFSFPCDLKLSKFKATIVFPDAVLLYCPTYRVNDARSILIFTHQFLFVNCWSFGYIIRLLDYTEVGTDSMF